MTNKLPIVGRKYRAFTNGNDEFEVAFIGKKSMCLIEKDGELSIQGLNDFFTYYEELSEAQEPQICKIHGNDYPSYCTQYNDDGTEKLFVVCDICMKGKQESEKANAVDGALSELKEIACSLDVTPSGYSERWHDGNTWWEVYKNLRIKAQNLVNALEAEKKHIKTCGNCGEPFYTKEAYDFHACFEKLSSSETKQNMASSDATDICVGRMEAIEEEIAEAKRYIETGKDLAISTRRSCYEYMIMELIINAVESMRKEIQELKNKGK